MLDREVDTGEGLTGRWTIVDGWNQCDRVLLGVVVLDTEIFLAMDRQISRLCLFIGG